MQTKDRSNLKYANWFMRLQTFRDIYPHFMKCGRPIKEMTESMGIYAALTKVFEKGDFKQPHNLICIGDGTTPRTGALIAHLTKWRVWSIDPIMRLDRGVTKNLTLIKNKVENIRRGVLPERAILVSPHGHFDMRKAIQLMNPSLIITMPCCFFEKQTLNEDPQWDYRDPYVLTEHNRILIYKR